MLYGEVSVILQPDKQGRGKILLHAEGARRCAPYDEIMDKAEAKSCGQFWIWKGQDPQPEWMWKALEDDRAIYVARIHLNPKFKVVYIFSEGPLSKAIEEMWKQDQAYEHVDHDLASGISSRTGEYLPISLYIRLLEADFPLLDSGIYTEDFQLGPPK